MQSTTVKEKVKWIFQTKKGFIACSELIINELGSCPTRSDNDYFANNEQAWLAVFTAMFCSRNDKHNLIKLLLYINWSTQAVNSISERAIWNSKKPIKFAHL